MSSFTLAESAYIHDDDKHLGDLNIGPASALSRVHFHGNTEISTRPFMIYLLNPSEEPHQPATPAAEQPQHSQVNASYQHPLSMRIKSISSTTLGKEAKVRDSRDQKEIKKVNVLKALGVLSLVANFVMHGVDLIVNGCGVGM